MPPGRRAGGASAMLPAHAAGPCSAPATKSPSSLRSFPSSCWAPGHWAQPTMGPSRLALLGQPSRQGQTAGGGVGLCLRHTGEVATPDDHGHPEGMGRAPGGGPAHNGGAGQRGCGPRQPRHWLLLSELALEGLELSRGRSDWGVRARTVAGGGLWPISGAGRVGDEEAGFPMLGVTWYGPHLQQRGPGSGPEHEGKGPGPLGSPGVAGHVGRAPGPQGPPVCSTQEASHSPSLQPHHTVLTWSSLTPVGGPCWLETDARPGRVPPPVSSPTPCAPRRQAGELIFP